MKGREITAKRTARRSERKSGGMRVFKVCEIEYGRGGSLTVERARGRRGERGCLERHYASK